MGFELNKTHLDTSKFNYNKVYYFITQQAVLVANEYFEALDLKIKYQSIKLLKNKLSNQTYNILVLADIHTLKDYIKFKTK